MRRILLICALSLTMGACRTLDSSESKKPQITKDMPIEEAYMAAINFGGEVLIQVRDLARDRQQLGNLSHLAEKDLLNRATALSPATLIHVAHVYRVSSSQLNPKIFNNLVVSRDNGIRQIAWRLAAAKPSSEIAQSIEGVLNKALAEGREDEVLMPEMAKAIQENGLKSAYTFLVRGLLVDGSPEYARAMLALDPSKAAPPFIDYLGKADLEDLRQLNQKTVDVYTCTVIFRFFLENPLPVAHPGLQQIFLFAVSRNRALAEMAYAVLEKHIPEHKIVLATLLARTPAQVQLAFIESSQQEMTANVRLLLSELKEVAQTKEVLEELNIQRQPVAR